MRHRDERIVVRVGNSERASIPDSKLITARNPYVAGRRPRLHSTRAGRWLNPQAGRHVVGGVDVELAARSETQVNSIEANFADVVEVPVGRGGSMDVEISAIMMEVNPIGVGRIPPPQVMTVTEVPRGICQRTGDLKQRLQRGPY